MRWSILFLSLFFLNIGFCQNSVITGIVNSGSFLGPVGKVHVRMGKNSTRTDYEGKFSLPYTANESLIFSHSKFNTQKIPPASIITKSNNIYYLTPTSNLSSNILESAGVEKIHDPHFEHVFDYTFLSDTLIVLSYMHLGKTDGRRNVKPYINCAFSAFKYGELIERQIIPDLIQNLNLSPEGELYFVGADTCYILERNRERLTLEGVNFKNYINFTSLAYAKNDNGTFLSFSYPFIPQVAHKMYNPQRDEEYLLELVQNPKYFNKVADDYTMLQDNELAVALKLEESTGVNHRMFSTYLRSFYILRDISMPYAPGFMVNNEILVFDNMNNTLNYYNGDGVYNRSVGIYHNSLLKEDLVKIIQDPFNQTLFTLHNKSGVLYLRQVNIQTGATGRPFKLHHPFAENVKVFESYVYYLYKSPHDEKVYHLIREKLPFDNSGISSENEMLQLD